MNTDRFHGSPLFTGPLGQQYGDGGRNVMLPVAGLPSASISPSPSRTNRVRILRYGSLLELRQLMSWIDRRSAAELNVLFQVDGSIRGNLSDLVRRDHDANHLVIVPENGIWPGLDSGGDLALRARQLGWQSIDVIRDVQEGIAAAIQSMHGKSTLVLLLPNGSMRQPVM